MATTKKAETKTTKAAAQPPKTEAVKLEEEYVEVTIPVDYTTDEEMLYVAVNGVGMNIPYGETVKVKQPYAAEIKRYIAQREANRKKSEAQKNKGDYYVNSTT